MKTIKKIFLLSAFTILYSFNISAQCPASGYWSINGLTVNFYNTSSSFSSSSWDFGDGNTSNATNPIHTYASAGSYYVTLEIGYPFYTNYGTFTSYCSVGGTITVTGPTNIYGCTDPIATNYDPLATSDDGSCTYIYGCTDSIATNYNPNAGVDDGSCIYPHICGEITGITLTDIINDRVTFNWDDMNDSLCVVDQIRIRYREVGTSTYSTKTMGSPVGNNSICLNTSKRILNLSDSTKYEYGFKIWYQDGTIKDWHSEDKFITLDRCPNVANLSVTTPSSSRAKFTWDNSNGPYSFVRIKIRVDSISNPTSNSWFNSGGFGTNHGTFSSIKNGLVPGETYRSQAKTWCDPAGGPYKAPSWTPLIFWTQPTTARIEGGIPTANLDVYPNPSRDMFNVSFKSEDIQNLEVRIVNVIGEVIYNEELQQFVGEYTKSIDLSAYTKGVYFLEITADNGVVNKKIILQ